LTAKRSGGEKKTFEVKVGKLEEGEVAEAEIEEEKDLGMSVDEITPELARQLGLSVESGVVVVQVEAQSAAGEAGMRRGDVILEIDQERVKSIDDYRERIPRYKKGDTVLFLVQRRGATLYLTLKIWE
jgi:serine protease Do